MVTGCGWTVDAGGDVARPQEREIVRKVERFGKSEMDAERMDCDVDFLTAEDTEGAEETEGFEISDWRFAQGLSRQSLGSDGSGATMTLLDGLACG